MPENLQTQTEASATETQTQDQSQQNTNTSPENDAGGTTAAAATTNATDAGATTQNQTVTDEAQSNGENNEAQDKSATPSLDPKEFERLKTENEELSEFRKLKEAGIKPDDALSLYEKQQQSSIENELKQLGEQRRKSIEDRQESLIKSEISNRVSASDTKIQAQLQREGYDLNDLKTPGSEAHLQYWSRMNQETAPIEQSVRESVSQVSALQRQLSEIAIDTAFKEIDHLVESEFPFADPVIVKRFIATQTPTTESEQTALRGAYRQFLNDLNQVGVRASAKQTAELTRVKSELEALKLEHSKQVSQARQQGRDDSLQGQQQAYSKQLPLGKTNGNSSAPAKKQSIAEYTPYF